MITQEQEELAALQALDLLEGDDLIRFQQACAADPSLSGLVEELRQVSAQLACTSPKLDPPDRIWQAIKQEIQGGPEPTPADLPRAPAVAVAPESTFAWFPWAIAAALAVCCGVLFFRSTETTPSTPVAVATADLSIAVLHGAEEGYSMGDAVVVWDPVKQTGVLDLARMPRPGEDQDYQLWVIDPQYDKPVDGGVFAVDQQGNGKLTFHPKLPIAEAKVFAISLEPRGGSPSARGPIVMASR